MSMRVAVLASGNGTNFQALVDAARAGTLGAEVAVLVASRADAGAVERARRAGVPVAVASPSDGPALERTLAEHKVDLVVLAGWMHHVSAGVVRAFKDRMINVHPALLPAFGGKGMYGHHVHEAVLAAGVRVSGCTVHLVDDEYDHGPVILQQPVEVLEHDTVDTLSARIRVQEHALLVKATRLFAEGRVRVGEGRVRISPPVRGARRVKRALLSVSDKSGIVDLARGLAKHGVEIISTGGTAKALMEAGIHVRTVESVTGSPEMLDGRVKTLHPRIHGALLYRRDVPAHVDQVAEFMLEDIDLVAVNLYPFARAAQKYPAFASSLMEEIDIGGPTMIRAAAKNCEALTVITDPADYERVLAEIAREGDTTASTRRELAAKVYRHTSHYDAMIAHALAPDDGLLPELVVPLTRVQALRYGENPHQPGALYRPSGAPEPFKQLHGKELSYNNLLDAQGAWEAVNEFSAPGAVIFKHVTPCGAGTGADVVTAYKRAFETDPVCAFGGILALNRPLDLAVAEAIGDLFLEVIVAPSYEPAALAALQRKKNLRLIERPAPERSRWQWRSVGPDFVVHARDAALFDADAGDPPWKVATRRAPTTEEVEGLKFAWAVCKYVKSNAIVVATPGQALGLGAGQMSRVDSVHMAGVKMEAMGKRQPLPALKVAASDAFFPFRDGLDGLRELGVTAVVQPGGSVRDAEIIAAADEAGMAMVMTGMRHFRH